MQMTNRHSIRLPGYDYSQSGAYFLTLCSWKHECIFGEIKDNEMVLNEYGEIVSEEWMHSADIREELMLDAMVIMPNHLHGIVFLENPVGAHGRAPVQESNNSSVQRKPKSIGSFIAGIKASVTQKINQCRNMPGMPVWQRNYYEHVIRNEKELFDIREYIQNNPLQWDLDNENVKNVMCGRTAVRPYNE